MAANGNPNTTDPRGNAATRSATALREASFKNYKEEGKQYFQDSTINSDLCSCVQSRIGSDGVVYNGGRGEQNFQNSKINGVEVKSSSSSETTSRVIYCTTCQSFNNHGTGFQKFNGAVILIGEKEVVGEKVLGRVKSCPAK